MVRLATLATNPDATLAAKTCSNSPMWWSTPACLCKTPRMPRIATTKKQFDKIGPLSTMGSITLVWMTICTVVEILEERGVKIYINPSHNVPGDTTAQQRLDEAIDEYKRRLKVL